MVRKHTTTHIKHATYTPTIPLAIYFTFRTMGQFLPSYIKVRYATKSTIREGHCWREEHCWRDGAMGQFLPLIWQSLRDWPCLFSWDFLKTGQNLPHCPIPPSLSPVVFSSLYIYIDIYIYIVLLPPLKIIINNNK